MPDKEHYIGKWGRSARPERIRMARGGKLMKLPKTLENVHMHFYIECKVCYKRRVFSAYFEEKHAEKWLDTLRKQGWRIIVFDRYSHGVVCPSCARITKVPIKLKRT